MKNKKIRIIFIIIFIVILIIGYFLIKHFKKENNENIQSEYTPQEEITDEQARQTIVSLYFPLKENEELNPEARLIDIKEIINNPYEKLIQLLIEGPKNEKNKKIIPEKTKLNKNYLEGDCIVLDFSSEILNYSKDNKNEKNNIINSIVNTLTELTEVNKVKILIDGKENNEFKNIYEREK